MAFPLPLSSRDIYSGSILFAVLKLFLGISEGLPNYRIQLAFFLFRFFSYFMHTLLHRSISFITAFPYHIFELSKPGSIFSNTYLSDLSIVGTRDIFV